MALLKWPKSNIKTSKRLDALASKKEEPECWADDVCYENEEELACAEHKCFIDGIDLCYRAAGRPIYHVVVDESGNSIELKKHLFFIGTEQEISATLKTLNDKEPDADAARRNEQAAKIKRYTNIPEDIPETDE